MENFEQYARRQEEEIVKAKTKQYTFRQSLPDEITQVLNELYEERLSEKQQQKQNTQSQEREVMEISSDDEKENRIPWYHSKKETGKRKRCVLKVDENTGRDIQENSMLMYWRMNTKSSKHIKFTDDGANHSVGRTSASTWYQDQLARQNQPKNNNQTKFIDYSFKR
jgi:hypothetical protein